MIKWITGIFALFLASTILFLISFAVYEDFRVYNTSPIKVGDVVNHKLGVKGLVVSYSVLRPGWQNDLVYVVNSVSESGSMTKQHWHLIEIDLK